MAHIQKMTDKPRTLTWRAQVRRKGHPTLVKMFKTKAEAEHWADEQERNIRLTGLPLTVEDLKKHTVGDIVRRYLQEITPAKGSSISERTVLNAFLRRELCRKSLAYVKRQDAYSYVAERLKDEWRGKVITPRTVRREINSIQHIFEVARDRWGFENLHNPFRGISIKGSMHRRDRRLKEGELERLYDSIKLCRGLNREYVALAVDLAIESGMRLQEIFNLTWQDVDFAKRHIHIRKSKTDHLNAYKGRTIVMSVLSIFFLGRLGVKLGRETQFQSSARIFPKSREAFKQSWADVVKRAGIKNLTFHDLRREAGSRFDEAGLTKAEHDLMMGHASRDMASLYIHSSLKSIEHKLDRQVLHGQTLDEMMQSTESRELSTDAIVWGNAFLEAIERGLAKDQINRHVDLALRAWKTDGKVPASVDPKLLIGRRSSRAVA
jgi:integrase